METAFLNSFPMWMLILFLWSLPWKGYALWKAAQLSHKWWFLVIFLANTFGILEIFYIFVVARKYSVEITESK